MSGYGLNGLGIGNAARNIEKSVQQTISNSKVKFSKVNNLKNSFSKLSDGFTENLFQSPEKLSSAMRTIDSISSKLSQVSYFINEAKVGNYSDNERLAKQEEFLKIVDDVKILKNSDEFKTIYKNLENIGIKLNIGSQKVENFLNHFFDSSLEESQPDLVGIFDQISSINRLNASDFAQSETHLFAALNGNDEDGNISSYESVAMINKENSNVDNTISLDRVEEAFKNFEKLDFDIEGDNLLLSVNGFNMAESSDGFRAAHLFDTETQELSSSFTHADFDTNKTFKGAEIKNNLVYVNSEGSEYIFNVKGDFINKFNSAGNKINESTVVEDKMYAIAPASEKVDGEIVGALHVFDLESGEAIDEISKARNSQGSVFGTNIESNGKDLYIAESELVTEKGQKLTQGKVHVFDTESNTFEGEFTPNSATKGVGTFGKNISVNDRFLAVSTKADGASASAGSTIHVFDLNKGNQIHTVNPHYFGTELDGNIELNDNKLLMSAKDKNNRSNIYEFDLSTREKNLEKFQSLIGDDARVIDAIKTSMVADRMNSKNSQLGKLSQQNSRANNLNEFNQGLNTKGQVYSGRTDKASTYEGRESQEINNQENVAKESMVYQGREGKEYTGRDGNVYEGREDKVLDTRNNNIYEGINSNIKDLRNEVEAHEERVLEKHEAAPEIKKAAVRNRNLKIEEKTDLREDILDNISKKIKDRRDEKSNDIQGEIVEKKEIADDVEREVNLSESIEAQSGPEIKAEDAFSELDDFIYSLEHSAFIAANQTNELLKSKIKHEKDSSLKTQAYISATASIDLLP